MKLVFRQILGVSALLIVACDPQPVEIEVELFGQGAGFDGLYSIDSSDDEVEFSSQETTTDVHKYEADVKIVDSIDIDIFPAATEANDDGDETNMTSLTCRISSDGGDVLYEETYTITSTAMKSFSYEVE